jgi:chromosome segregation ATPase
MLEASERGEEVESRRESPVERKIVFQDFQELRQTITTLETDWGTLVEKLNAEIQEKAAKIGVLTEETENLKREHQQEVQRFEEQVGEQDHKFESVLNEAEKLRQTISTLEAQREALDKKNAELTKQLQESRDRLKMLTQELADRAKTLEQVSQTSQALVETLDREIQARGTQISDLQEKIRILESEYQQKAETLDEILESPTIGGRDAVMKKLLEDLTSARRFLLKVTCPHCKGRISRRFKAELKSKEESKSVTG